MENTTVVSFKDIKKQFDQRSPDEPINRVDRPCLENGSIDPISYRVDQPDLDLSNRVYKPDLNNRGYRPDLMTLDRLRKNPLKIILFLFNQVSYALETDHYITDKLQRKQIAESLAISTESVKTACRFLIGRGWISRADFSRGRAGYTRYALSKAVYESLKTDIKNRGYKPDLEIGSNSNNNLFNNIITTTATQGSHNVKMAPISLHKHDSAVLAKAGLHTHHLKQLNSIAPDVLSQSLSHFAFALQHNTTVKNYEKPIAAFIAVMKREGVWDEPGYRSPEAIAQETQQRAEQKRRAQAIKQQEALEQERYDTAYNAWKDSLSDAEKQAVVQSAPARYRCFSTGVLLRTHFGESVWKKHKNAEIAKATKVL